MSSCENPEYDEGRGAFWLYRIVSLAVPRFIQPLLAAAGRKTILRHFAACRATVRKNLAVVAPQTAQSPEALDAAVDRVFINRVLAVLDRMNFSRMSVRKVLRIFTRVDGLENLDKALRRKNGVLLVSPPLGNWEAAALYLASRERKVSIVSRAPASGRMKNFEEKIRRRFGVDTIRQSDEKGLRPLSGVPMLEIIRRCAANEIIALPAENGRAANCVPCDFFGRAVPFGRLPFEISKVTGAPILPAFVFSENGRYSLSVEPEIDFTGLDEVADGVARLAAVVERAIARRPLDWFACEDFFRAAD